MSFRLGGAASQASRAFRPTRVSIIAARSADGRHGTHLAYLENRRADRGRWFDVLMAIPVRIVIIDAHAIARAGVKAILADSGDFHVVGECSTGRSAVALADRLAPDVFLIDPSALNFDGPCLVRALVHHLPDCAVVVFATAPGRHVLDAFQAGARGVLLKSDAPDDLLEILRAVHAGGWCLSRAACPSKEDSAAKGQEASLTDLVQDSDPRLN